MTISFGSAAQWQSQLIAGINTASAMLAQQSGPGYGIGKKQSAITDGLKALRSIGFGPDVSRLTGSGLHAAVADWVLKNGVNALPLPPTPVVRGDKVDFGKGCVEVALQRTLRVSDDGSTHKLPPGFGNFPMREIKNYAGRVPADWSEKGGVLVPLWQREALWLHFSGNKEGKPPVALMIASGMINAVSGAPWNEGMNTTARAQNYVVAGRSEGERHQPWLDGWNAGADAGGRDVVRQFVAMPLGLGYTMEKQLTGKEEHGGIQLLARRMRPDAMAAQMNPYLTRLLGRLHQPVASEPPDIFLGATRGGGLLGGSFRGGPSFESMRGGESAAFFSMGLAAGGEIEQQIFKDPYGLDAWDPSDEATGRLWVHLVNSEGWTTITGEAPPATPVTRQQYAQYGYPWFEYYDEQAPTANRPSRLAHAPGLAEIDQSHGFKTDAAAPSPGGKTIVLDPKNPAHVIGVKPSPVLPKAEIKGGADQGKWPGGGKKGQ